MVLKMMKNVERGCELQYVVFRFGNELRVRGGEIRMDDEEYGECGG